ncbi:MAG TPA: alpha/beta hydrolase [Caulobacterales bacterium]|nr:alpha/beta hydrolase [Caulobacterales bacterium]
MTARHVEANGVRIALDSVGRGPLLILIHGGEAGRGMYANLAPLLADAFMVASYDQRDTGDTLANPTRYMMEDLGADLAALIQALGHSRAHVFGTSFGSLIAQEAALAFPNAIDRLILSAPLREPRNDLNPAAISLAAAAAQGDASAASRFAALMFAPGATVARPDLLDTLSAINAPRTLEQSARRREAARACSTTTRLQRIAAPTLVMCGGGDQIISPDVAYAIARAAPNADFTMLAGLGHALTLEAPRRVAAAIRTFLQSK